MAINKHRESALMRWSKVSKEERSKYWSNIAKKGWAKKSKKKRKEIAMNLVEARRNKNG